MNETELLFKLSNLNPNYALTLGYLNSAFKNLAMVKKQTVDNVM